MISDDKAYKAIKWVLDNGSFSIKGREALAISEIYRWVLEKEKTLLNKPPEKKKK